MPRATKTNKIKKIKTKNHLFNEIKTLLKAAKNQVVKAVNSAMVLTYFQVGKIIVRHEQDGKEKAFYGKETLKELSKNLTKEFGTGFSITNLQQMRSFYLAYQKQQTLSAKFILSWSHYVFLMRMNDQERGFYEIESIENNWSVRELERQYDSGLFERLTLSKNKKKVKELSQKGQILSRVQDAIKDSYVLEFLGLEEKANYSESDLEQAVIDKIEHFLLEFGKGFTFAGRQKRFTFDEKHFFVDLVFYNRLLRCFVLIDLKIGDLKHQDLGQMQMYVSYYNRFVKTKEENKTIGIVLCKNKSDSLVEITLPKNNNRIFASKYKLYLPSKKELMKQLI